MGLIDVNAGSGKCLVLSDKTFALTNVHQDSYGVIRSQFVDYMR